MNQVTLVNLTLLISTFLLMNGCAAMPDAPAPEPLSAPTTQYDARVVAPPDTRPLGIGELAERLAGTDVVVVGEYHGHHASHLLQSRLQQALYRQHPRQVLSMEQFDLDHQDALNRYLTGDIGEAEMMEDAEAWDNYRGAYRPLVEFARLHDLPVIAANAPAHVVRCVGRQGTEYLDNLPEPVRHSLPAKPFLDIPAYREKFMAAIGASHRADSTMEERMSNTYKAQLLRDNTMAERILQARSQYPEHQILHITGTFHSEQGLGTVALLKQRAPAVSVAVISPVVWPREADTPPLAENRSRGDYLYLIQPLPEEFRDPERARKAMAERFSASARTDCD